MSCMWLQTNMLELMVESALALVASTWAFHRHECAVSKSKPSYGSSDLCISNWTVHPFPKATKNRGFVVFYVVRLLVGRWCFRHEDNVSALPGVLVCMQSADVTSHQSAWHDRFGWLLSFLLGFCCCQRQLSQALCTAQEALLMVCWWKSPLMRQNTESSV